MTVTFNFRTQVVQVVGPSKIKPGPFLADIVRFQDDPCRQFMLESISPGLFVRSGIQAFRVSDRTMDTLADKGQLTQRGSRRKPHPIRERITRERITQPCTRG